MPEALRAYNAVDFDDLILLPALLFRDNAHILQPDRIRYLLVVSGYQPQSVSAGQTADRRTASPDRGGDDDQSIYAWRGARPENLAQLARFSPASRLSNWSRTTVQPPASCMLPTP